MERDSIREKTVTCVSQFEMAWKKEAGIVSFMHDRLQLLRSANHLCAEGNFKFVPNGFQQLYTILVVRQGNGTIVLR